MHFRHLEVLIIQKILNHPKVQFVYNFGQNRKKQAVFPIDKDNHSLNSSN